MLRFTLPAVFSRGVRLVGLCVALAVPALVPACGDGDGDGNTAGSGGNNNGSGGSGGASMCSGALCDIYCEFGNKVDANGCETCACNPPPVCNTADLVCPAIYCENGYARDAAGCPTCQCNPTGVCTPDACGALPPVIEYCPDGSEKTAMCAANRSGSCSWFWRDCGGCPLVDCDVYCEYGHQVNEQGCSTCACNPGPGECPAVACLIACEYGFAKNASGCDVCQCAPPPACDRDACGPPTPGAPFQCPDGSIQGQTCARGDNGQCSWTRTPCPASCATFRDLGTCEAQSHCQWLEPGCEGNALPRAGCYERINVHCAERGAAQGCTNGGTCRQVTVDPCAGRPEVRCLTCASPVSVCVVPALAVPQ